MEEGRKHIHATAAAALTHHRQTATCALINSVHIVVAVVVVADPSLNDGAVAIESTINRLNNWYFIIGNKHTNYLLEKRVNEI